MTKPKQAQKTLSENTGKTFSVIMPPFSSKGGGIITEMTVLFKHHSCLCEFKKMLKQGAAVESFLFLRNPIWWIFASKNRSIVSNKTSTRLCKHQIFVSNLSASSTYSSYFPFNMFEKLKQSDYRISKIPLPISGSELFSQMHKSSWRWVKWENVNRGTLKI